MFSKLRRGASRLIVAAAVTHDTPSKEPDVTAASPCFEYPTAFAVSPRGTTKYSAILRAAWFPRKNAGSPIDITGITAQCTAHRAGAAAANTEEPTVADDSSSAGSDASTPPDPAASMLALASICDYRM